ncbi:MAG: hypothetical protein ACM362_14450 [Candidatus Methylomirabilota bacterium]
MNHHASPDFWARYRALPAPVQDLANKAFDLLKADPKHPSLHFKKVGRFWSARVGLHHRAVAVEASDGLVWFWIGTHAEYDKLVG